MSISIRIGTLLLPNIEHIYGERNFYVSISKIKHLKDVESINFAFFLYKLKSNSVIS